MTQRELVMEAINQRPTDRLPFSWGLGLTREMTGTMEAYAREKGQDFAKFRRNTEHVLTIHPRYMGPVLPENRDFWGIERREVSYGGGAYKEISRYPLAGIDDPEDLERYPWPRPEEFDFSAKEEEVLREDPRGEKARRLSIGYCGNPLEIYTWMTGMEETMMNLILNPDLVHRAMAKICDFFAAMMEMAAPRFGHLVDILYFADDLGGQENEIISNGTYREMIKPHHKRLMDLGKRLMPHAKVMYHTDGSVFNIIPELIDAGMEIHEAVQTDAARMEPERIKKAYGDRLCFHGALSVQSLLPQGTEGEVRREVERICRILGAGGGFVPAPSHAIQPGTPPENVYAMVESVLGAERFEQALRN